MRFLIAASALSLTPVARAKKPDTAVKIDESLVIEGAPADGTAAEQAALTAVRADKWVTARELAERILKDHPQSYAAHYVLGMAMHYGEGDLPRSVVHLERATRLFEARYGLTPGADAPLHWHIDALKELGYSLDQMDRPAEELVVLDRFDHAYTPERIAERVWPLMKLRRFDEARRTAAAAIAIAAHDPQQLDQAIVARTGLCATEFEAGDRDAAYRACKEAIQPYLTRFLTLGEMEFSNASEAALGLYKFDEAERYIQESIKRAGGDVWGNPYQHLATLYLNEGRVAEAIEALKSGQELRLSRPAWLDQHGQARLDATVGALLLVVGETERALQLAARAEAQPDRVGVWSGTEAQAAAGTAVLVAVATREQAARHEEEAVTAGFLDGARLRWRALEERVAAWHAERRVAVLLADETLLEGTMRPYYVGGADLSGWMVPELVHMLGPGVVRRAVAMARAIDKTQAAGAYFDATDAEVSYTRGDWSEALATAERSLARLPKAEALLSGRASAIAAVSARRLGERERSTGYFATVMTRDPDVLRRLGVALPVAVETDGSAVASEAAVMVGRSPRFDVVGGGHIVGLRGAGSLEACLYGPRHEMLQCTNLAPEPGSSVNSQARKLVAALHKVAFSYKADLSQSDLTTLDGSPTAARASQQVKGLLEMVAPGPAIK